MATHVIRYTTLSGDRYIQGRYDSYDAALDEWSELDALRQTGYLKFVQHFEVRDIADPSNPAITIPARPNNWRASGSKDGVDYNRLPQNIKVVPGQSMYTFQCVGCGKAFQGSGLGLGSHRRGCTQTSWTGWGKPA